MAKFLNKKEQVYNLELTTYGHYLFSIGRFKPVYYAFFDDNVLYDGEYAGLTQSQNSIHERIKQNTPYLESLTLFENIEKQAAFGHDTEGNLFYEYDITPTMKSPRKDNLRFTSMIGDAFLDGETQHAPAWKIVTLAGNVSSSADIDVKNDIAIPQINIDVNYTLRVVDNSIQIDPTNMQQLHETIGTFADGKIIELHTDDPLVYIEEVNTELLTENFQIEVFEIDKDAVLAPCADGTWRGAPPSTSPNASPPAAIPGCHATDDFNRKYFEKKQAQIVDGYFVSPTVKMNPVEAYTTGSVEYFFNLYSDWEIGEADACKSAALFNKSSYYIDLDFDCEEHEEDLIYVDIYGKVTEPEICPT